MASKSGGTFVVYEGVAFSMRYRSVSLFKHFAIISTMVFAGCEPRAAYKIGIYNCSQEMVDLHLQSNTYASPFRDPQPFSPGKVWYEGGVTKPIPEEMTVTWKVRGETFSERFALEVPDWFFEGDSELSAVFCSDRMVMLVHDRLTGRTALPIPGAEITIINPTHLCDFCDRFPGDTTPARPPTDH